MAIHSSVSMSSVRAFFLRTSLQSESDDERSKESAHQSRMFPARGLARVNAPRVEVAVGQGKQGSIVSVSFSAPGGGGSQAMPRRTRLQGS